jgi:hypothetical protein
MPATAVRPVCSSAGKAKAVTPERLRDDLTKLYGPDTDWALAVKAAPDFGVTTLTVYRWLQGTRRMGGAAMRVLSHLVKSPPGRSRDVD